MIKLRSKRARRPRKTCGAVRRAGARAPRSAETDARTTSPLATGVGRRFIIELEAGKPSCQLGKALVVAAAVGLRPIDLMAENNDDNALLPDLPDERRGARAWLSSRSSTRRAASAPSRRTRTAVVRLRARMAAHERRVPALDPDAAVAAPHAAAACSRRGPPTCCRRPRSCRTVGRRLGAAPEDTIAILAEIGRDTAGALSIGKPGSASIRAVGVPVPDEAALERIIDELPSKPFLVGEDGVSMSLAGVQNKLGVAVDARRPHLHPARRRAIHAHSEARLRPPVRRRAERSAVPDARAPHAASTRRASRPARPASAPTCSSRATTASSRPAAGAGCIRRISARRWASRHRPSTRPTRPASRARRSLDMFALTRNAMRAPDVLGLLDHVIFNVLACNTDAHAKNYSLMISGSGFALAPIYDVMCAAAWDGITRNLAQKIAGKNRGEHLKRRHWQAFAAECGLSAPRCSSSASRSLPARVLREVRGRRRRGRCHAGRHARAHAEVRRGHRGTARARSSRGWATTRRCDRSARDHAAGSAATERQEAAQEKSEGGNPLRGRRLRNHWTADRSALVISPGG